MFVIGIWVFVSIGLTILIYFAWRVWIGHSIGLHLASCEHRYGELSRRTGSRKYALRRALEVFQDCPRLNELRAQDIEQIVTILGPLENPTCVIHNLVMMLDSSKIVAALRNEPLLRDLVEVEHRKSAKATERNPIDPIKHHLRILADEAADLLDLYLKLDDHITQTQGTAGSLLRHVPFDRLLNESRSLAPLFATLIAKLHGFRSDNQTSLSGEQIVFLDALESYANALLNTVNRLVDRQQAAFQASQGPNRSTLTWTALSKLQESYAESIRGYVHAGTILQEHAKNVLI